MNQLPNAKENSIKGNTRNSNKYISIKGMDRIMGIRVRVGRTPSPGRTLTINSGEVTVLDENTFEGISVNQKEKIISFLKKSDNVFMADQIKIARKHTNELFPNNKITLELRPDYETGEDVLLFLIESRSDKLEEDVAKLHRLYEYVDLNDQFIVDLEFAQ